MLKKSKITQILGVFMADYDYQYWYEQIAQYDRAFKKWEGRAERLSSVIVMILAVKIIPLQDLIFFGLMFKPSHQQSLLDFLNPM